MAKTQINGANGVQPGSLIRSLLNTTTAGSAVVAKVLPGAGIVLTSTGADSGTGDVTVAVQDQTTTVAFTHAAFGGV